MQHRTKMRGIQDDVSEPPSHQHEILHKVQSVVFSTRLASHMIFVIFISFFLYVFISMLILITHRIVYINMSHKCPKPGSVFSPETSGL